MWFWLENTLCILSLLIRLASLLPLSISAARRVLYINAYIYSAISSNFPIACGAAAKPSLWIG